MSIKIFLILSLLAAMTVIILSPKPGYALSECPGATAQTDPTPLANNQRRALFTIDVRNNQNYDFFQMQFKCGIRPEANVEEAKKNEDGRSISVDLKREGFGLGTPCEFDLGTHEIIVTATIPGGQRVDQCLATYTVIDADALCKLEITPTSGITSASTLTVTGENLNKDHDFRLFIDNEAISSGYVNKPTFSGINIPNKFLTPGEHSANLRRCDFSNQPAGSCGPVLCPRVFSVGTPDDPGDVSPPGTEIPKGCTQEDIKSGKCTSAGGDPCDTQDNRGAAFKTAIGCIHTNPVELVKDFMTWVLGIGGGLAFLMMLLGVFQMLTSAGNPETLNAGRERLTSAVIGLLFIIFAILLLQIIGAGILNIPGFK